MAIEVLLMADVEKLGTLGSVVRVAEGYARNYLFPRKLASEISTGARARLVKLQREAETKRSETRNVAAALSSKLEAVTLTIPVKVGENDQMYGSVGASEILDALKAQGIEVDRATLALEAPLKTLGEFEVPFKLFADIEPRVTVRIVKE